MMIAYFRDGFNNYDVVTRKRITTVYAIFCSLIICFIVFLILSDAKQSSIEVGRGYKNFVINNFIGKIIRNDGLISVVIVFFSPIYMINSEKKSINIWVRMDKEIYYKQVIKKIYSTSAIVSCEIFLSALIVLGIFLKFEFTGIMLLLFFLNYFIQQCQMNGCSFGGVCDECTRKNYVFSEIEW